MAGFSVGGSVAASGKLEGQQLLSNKNGNPGPARAAFKMKLLLYKLSGFLHCGKFHSINQCEPNKR